MLNALAQRARGGTRANVFSFLRSYVLIITLTLRVRLRYVTVAGVERIAARGF